MSNTKISGLSVGNPAQNTDLIPIARPGSPDANYAVTAQSIAALNTSQGGTVTSIATGAGLTGGPITVSGTISIPTGGVINSMLANNTITVTAGSGLSGGGTVALGGAITLTWSGSPPYPNSGITGSGASPYIAIFNGAASIGNSNLQQVISPNGLKYTTAVAQYWQLDSSGLNFNTGIVAGGGNNVVIQNGYNAGSDNDAGGIVLQAAPTVDSASGGNAIIVGGINTNHLGNTPAQVIAQGGGQHLGGDVEIYGGDTSGNFEYGGRVIIAGGDVTSGTGSPGGQVYLQPGLGSGNYAGNVIISPNNVFQTFSASCELFVYNGETNPGLNIGYFATAPTSFNNGDIWATSSGVFARIAGATVALNTSYNIGCTWNGTIPASQVLFRIPLDQPVTYFHNFAPSQAYLETPPAAGCTINIIWRQAGTQTDVQIGQIAFGAGAYTGTFTSSFVSPPLAEFNANTGDLIKAVNSGTSDASAADFGMTLSGVKA